MAIFTPKLCLGGLSSLAGFVYVCEYFRVVRDRGKGKKSGRPNESKMIKLMLTKVMSVYEAGGRDYIG